MLMVLLRAQRGARRSHLLGWRLAAGTLPLAAACTACLLTEQRALGQCGGPWTELMPPTSPDRRDNANLAYDSGHGRTVLYGGIGTDAGSGYYNDVWEWNGLSWSPTSPSTRPPTTHGAPLAYDAARRVTVLFGGQSGPTNTNLDQTWVWDGTHWTHVVLTGPHPSARAYHALAYDPLRERVVLFGGGADGAAVLNDTWEWDGSAWAEIPTLPGGPMARRFSSAVFYPPRGKIVMYGGLTGSGSTQNDMWEWAGDHWDLIAQVGPQRSTICLASDDTTLLMYGGVDEHGLAVGTTFLFRNNQWSEYTGFAPRARVTSVACHAATGKFVLFSGYARDIPHNPPDTWTFDTALSIARSPAPVSACPFGGATFAVTAFGAAPLAYQWQVQTTPTTWTNLTNSPLSLPCGGVASANSPTSPQTEIGITPCAGTSRYLVRCMVSNACGSVNSAPAAYTVCYPDCNCSPQPPVLNVNDFICFQSKFAAGDPYANCDNSTTPPVLNVNDFLCFQSRFAAGCP
jgi:hypothetical protein